MNKTRLNPYKNFHKVYCVLLLKIIYNLFTWLILSFRIEKRRRRNLSRRLHPIFKNSHNQKQKLRNFRQHLKQQSVYSLTLQVTSMTAARDYSNFKNETMRKELEREDTTNSKLEAQLAEERPSPSTECRTPPKYQSITITIIKDFNTNRTR